MLSVEENSVGHVERVLNWPNLQESDFAQMCETHFKRTEVLAAATSSGRDLLAGQAPNAV